MNLLCRTLGHTYRLMSGVGATVYYCTRCGAKVTR